MNKKAISVVLAVAAVLAAVVPVSAKTAAAALPSVVDAGPSRSASGLPCRDYYVPVTMATNATTTYRVYAQLCTPRPRGKPAPVQVLLHGGTYDHAYWDWPFEPDRYSYVTHAVRQGFATLNVDRLGYGRSDRPNPRELGFDVHGYVTHQLVRHLRAGSLRTRFPTVILNGHSMGGITAEHALPHGGVAAAIISGLARDRTDHSTAAEPDPTFYPAEQDPKFASKSWPPGYLTTIPDTRASLFLETGDYDPAIVPHEENLKDTVSVAELRAVGQPLAASATAVPTYYVLGEHDLIACRTTKDCHTDPAAATTDLIIDGSGHSINMSRHARLFYRATFRWLATREERALATG